MVVCPRFYFINVDKVAHTVTLAEAKGKSLRIHPAHKSDQRVTQAGYDSATGTFNIPPRTAVVFVE